jgi:hypothetical protein
VIAAPTCAARGASLVGGDLLRHAGGIGGRIHRRGDAVGTELHSHGLLSRRVGLSPPLEIFRVESGEKKVEGLAIVAGQPQVVRIAGASQVADRQLSAHRSEEAIETERLEGTEVEPVPRLIGEVVWRRLQPVGVLRVFVRQLRQPAIDVACALPL